MSQTWADLPERGSTGALALIWWIGTVIGRPIGRFLLYPISCYYVLTAVEQRRASFRYLRRVLGRSPNWLHLCRHFHCFARTILDRAFLLAGHHEGYDLRVHNGELVFDQLGSGRGCLLLGSHLGSFEVLRVLAVTRRNFPLKVLMNVGHNPAITKFFNALNPDIARTIIPIEGPSSLIAVKERLDQGYLVGTLGDRVVRSEKAVRCRFLGDEASFPAGPVQLAMMTEAPVILAFALFSGGNRYDIFFERLTEGISAKFRRQPSVIQFWAQRYAERLEHYTRRFPYNWFNFYDFWDDLELHPRLGDARFGGGEP